MVFKEIFYCFGNCGSTLKHMGGVCFASYNNIPRKLRLEINKPLFQQQKKPWNEKYPEPQNNHVSPWSLQFYSHEMGVGKFCSQES
jgi:hypothetical protein